MMQNDSKESLKWLLKKFLNVHFYNSFINNHKDNERTNLLSDWRRSQIRNTTVIHYEICGLMINSNNRFDDDKITIKKEVNPELKEKLSLKNNGANEKVQLRSGTTKKSLWDHVGKAA